jgi:hypothetical protein
MKITIAHLTHTEQLMNSKRHHYRLFSFNVDEPQSGILKVKVPCAVCNTELTVKIRSDDSVYNLKVRLLILVFLMIALIVVTFATVHKGELSLIEGLMVTGSIFSFFGIIVCISKLHNDLTAKLIHPDDSNHMIVDNNEKDIMTIER